MSFGESKERKDNKIYLGLEWLLCTLKLTLNPNRESFTEESIVCSDYLCCHCLPTLNKGNMTNKQLNT